MKATLWQPLALLVASFFTRFFFLAQPNQVVFDEVHYGKFVSNYLTGVHFFDLHPPLTKLFGALAAYIGDFSPTFAFATIGETFTDPDYIFLRIIPAICGFLLPVIVYYLAIELGISKIAAFFAGALVIFENSLLVQSKFLLIDGQLIFFGFTSLLFYLLFRNRQHRSYLIAAALFLGATISIKWTGLSFLAICLLWEMASYIHERNKTRLVHILALLLIPFAIYVATFAIHFHLLTKPGPGDPFMSQGFLQKSFPVQFVELHVEMFLQNKNLAATHAYSSKWYAWPLMTRPIYYWQNADQKIYSTGNVIIYWLAFAAMLGLLYHTIRRTTFFKTKRRTIIFLIFGYAINFLPFMFLTRLSFQYYYLAALVFAILALTLLIDSMKNIRIKKQSIILIILLAAALFLYFSPFTYGFPLTPEAQQSHFWFSSWQ